VFLIVWIGQVISSIGTGLTSFALGVQVYQATGSITRFALISLFATLPGILLGPLAGALVDRWDRRSAMILSDIGAGVCTLAVFLLLASGRLALWQIYMAVCISGTFGALRIPALTAATTQLVPARLYGRASGMLQVMQVGQYLVSPLLAGALIGAIGLGGVVLIDFSTFLIALFTLLAVRIPRPAVTTEGRRVQGSLLREALFGWRYINDRAGLRGLMVLFAIANFTTEMSLVLFTPLFLTLGSAAALGRAISIAGVGFLAGSLLMSVWGGGRRRVRTVLASLLALGTFMGLIGLNTSVPFITSCIFMTAFCSPIVSAANQAIWQAKVAPDVQGRVFAIRRTIILAAPPLAYALAGPLADHLFEPLLRSGGALAANMGRVIGVGPGRGIALIFLLMGILLAAATLAGQLAPRLRQVEDELPEASAA
jgi:MFS family permease